MQLFHWSSKNAVYVPEIDAEHRAIFLAGGELERALAAGAPKARLREMVDALIDHAEDHFSHEERLMRKMRYEAFDWHKKQHDGVRRRLKQYGTRIESDDRSAATEMLEYLAHWLRDHTGLSDRLMAARIRSVERQQRRAS
jgi:hemerythrin